MSVLSHRQTLATSEIRIGIVLKLDEITRIVKKIHNEIFWAINFVTGRSFGSTLELAKAQMELQKLSKSDNK